MIGDNDNIMATIIRRNDGSRTQIRQGCAAIHLHRLMNSILISHRIKPTNVPLKIDGTHISDIIHLHTNTMKHYLRLTHIRIHAYTHTNVLARIMKSTYIE